METIKIRSSITQECKTSCVRRALLFSVTGALFLFGTVIFPWKLPLFLGSLLLIAIGLRPYRQLQLLENKPHELIFDGCKYTFTRKGKPLFSVFQANIDRLDYFEKEGAYGIAIDLCGQVDLLQKFDLPAFVTDSRQRAECDLFLPYFTKKSIALLTAPLE